MRIKSLTLCLFLALAGIRPAAQELIIAAPFGRPEMVMDESGNYSQAISVYSDSDVEMFVPDIIRERGLNGTSERSRARVRITPTCIRFIRLISFVVR